MLSKMILDEGERGGAAEPKHTLLYHNHDHKPCSRIGRAAGLNPIARREGGSHMMEGGIVRCDGKTVLFSPSGTHFLVCPEEGSVFEPN